MFSILLSVYRKEKTEFLTEALRSIVEQTLPPDEIVLGYRSARPFREASGIHGGSS